MASITPSERLHHELQDLAAGVGDGRVVSRTSELPEHAPDDAAP
jgi:hypothetical protein